jgi:hypothetical protein
MRSLLVVLLACAAHAADEVAVYARFETTASSTQLGIPAEVDPYDPDIVRVDARLTAPDGTERVQPCFWLVPQERWEQTAWSEERKKDVPWERFRARGDGRWCLRFSPPSAGAWRWRWEVSLRGAPAHALDGGGFTAAARLPPGSGPVVVAHGSRGFATADGAGFIPVGINCAWPIEAGSEIYAQWLDRLAENGANATRLWLVHYYGGTSLEWTRSGVNDGYAGVGRYSQEAAERVDRILDAAEARGIRIMLCLETFGDTNWDWVNNPYSRQGGGWLDDPHAFFTDERALAATRKLLRYEVARWGASRALWAWELWNEVDTSEGFDEATCRDWHQMMAREIRRLDAHHHLVTTDYRFTPPTTACAAYALPEIDFAQLHTYFPRVVEGFQVEIEHLAPFAKPVTVGEYGLHVDPTSLAADPAGEHLHDGLWGGLFCGSTGGGMGWWWDTYVAPRGLWRQCAGLARFTRGEALGDLAPVAAVCDDDTCPALALLGADRAWAWVRTPRATPLAGAGLGVRVAAYRVPRDHHARTLAIDGLRGRWWRVDWIDPYDGAWLGGTVIDAGNAAPLIPLPRFRHDLALKLRRLPVPEASPQGPPEPTPWHDEVERLLGQ